MIEVLIIQVILIVMFVGGIILYGKHQNRKNKDDQLTSKISIRKLKWICHRTITGEVHTALDCFGNEFRSIWVDNLCKIEIEKQKNKAESRYEDCIRAVIVIGDESDE